MDESFNYVIMYTPVCNNSVAWGIDNLLC